MNFFLCLSILLLLWKLTKFAINCQNMKFWKKKVKGKDFQILSQLIRLDEPSSEQNVWFGAILRKTPFLCSNAQGIHFGAICTALETQHLWSQQNILLDITINLEFLSVHFSDFFLHDNNPDFCQFAKNLEKF